MTTCKRESHAIQDNYCKGCVKTTLPSPNKIHNPPPAEVTRARCLQLTKTPKPSMYQLDRSVDSTARRWQMMILKTYFKVF